MSQNQDNIERLIERIQSLEEKGGRELSPDERIMLREVIEAWKIWKSFGVVSRLIIWILLTLAGAMIAWRQLREEVVRWLGNS